MSTVIETRSLSVEQSPPKSGESLILVSFPEKESTDHDFHDRILRTFLHEWDANLDEIVTSGRNKGRTSYFHGVAFALSSMQEDGVEFSGPVALAVRAHNWYFIESGLFRKHSGRTKRWEIIANDLVVHSVLLSRGVETFMNSTKSRLATLFH